MRRRISRSSLPPGIRHESSALLAFLVGFFAAVLTLSGCAGVTEKTSSPSPQISVSPSSLVFNNVIVGQKSSQAVQISNTGDANLNVTGVTLTGSGFSLSAVAVPFQLAPNSTKTV